MAKAALGRSRSCLGEASGTSQDSPAPERWSYFFTCMQRCKPLLPNQYFQYSPSFEKYRICRIHQCYVSISLMTRASEAKETGLLQLLQCKFLFSVTLPGSYWCCGNVLYQLCLCPHVLSKHHFSYTSGLLVFQKMPLVSSQLHQTNLATITAYIPSMKSSVDITGIMLTENFVPNL